MPSIKLKTKNKKSQLISLDVVQFRVVVDCAPLKIQPNPKQKCSKEPDELIKINFSAIVFHLQYTAVLL